VLEAFARAHDLGEVLDAGGFESGASDLDGAIVTGNYASEWVTESLADALESVFTVLIDTLPNRLVDRADVVLPGATWTEKAGVFENVDGRLQAFEAAIPVREGARPEGQIAMDVLALIEDAAGEQRREQSRDVVIEAMPGQVPGSTSVVEPGPAVRYNAASVRREMAGEISGLSAFETDVYHPPVPAKQEADMEMVEL